MKNLKFLFSISVLLCLIVFIMIKNQNNSYVCSHTFENFANTIYDSDDMWVEKELFEENLSLIREFDDEYNFSSPIPYELVLSRKIEMLTELWIKISLLNSTSGNNFEYIVYSVENNSVKRINAMTENNFKIDFIILNSFDNSIIGVSNNENLENKNLIFSKYNENSNLFEIIQPSLITQNQLFDKDFHYVAYPKFVKQNGNNEFLFIVEKVKDFSKRLEEFALISYDFNNDEYSLLANLDSLYPFDFVITEDKDLYFLMSTEKPQQFSYNYDYKQSLYKFSENDFQLIEKLPQEWITISNISSIDSNILWFDSIGFYDFSTNSWNQYYENIEEIKDRISGYYYGLSSPIAKLIFKSSDGTLWFKVENISFYNSGLGWYEPNSNTGCWITNYPGDVFEGADNNLYVILENRLYNYNKE